MILTPIAECLVMEVSRRSVAAGIRTSNFPLAEFFFPFKNVCCVVSVRQTTCNMMCGFNLIKHLNFIFHNVHLVIATMTKIGLDLTKQTQNMAEKLTSYSLIQLQLFDHLVL